MKDIRNVNTDNTIPISIQEMCPTCNQSVSKKIDIHTRITFAPKEHILVIHDDVAHPYGDYECPDCGHAVPGIQVVECPYCKETTVYRYDKCFGVWECTECLKGIVNANWDEFLEAFGIPTFKSRHLL